MRRRPATPSDGVTGAPGCGILRRRRSVGGAAAEVDVRCRVTVPASTSNLGPGFDCLGLALEPALRVDLGSRASPGVAIDLHGSETLAVPRDETNLIWVALRDTLQRLGVEPPGVQLHIHNEIPLARGLGSSGAAITAGVTLAHILADVGEPSRAAILADAVRLEGHPDNVAPQVLGGFVAATTVGERFHTVHLP